MPPTTLLLSIHEKYANLIFSGDKKVELRRVRPRLISGDLIVVYVTSPRKEVAGVLEVSKVVSMHPSSLWNLVKDQAGITREDFQDYFLDASVGFAIFVRKALHFSNPITLDQMREKWPGFRPPQGYRYLKYEEVLLIQSITQQNILSFSDQPHYHQEDLLNQGVSDTKEFILI